MQCVQSVKKGVKCTLVQALRLCTGLTAHRGSRGITLLFLDHGTRRGWGVSVTPQPLFTPGKDPVPIVQEAEWVQGRSGEVRKISPSPGFDTRTHQPVASHYTDYATWPKIREEVAWKFWWQRNFSTLWCDVFSICFHVNSVLCSVA